MDSVLHTGLNKISIIIYVNYYLRHLKSLKKNSMNISQQYGKNMDSNLKLRKRREKERVKRRSEYIIYIYNNSFLS
jgi:uncharacterized ion transporter superfamily protein YfcC